MDKLPISDFVKISTQLPEPLANFSPAKVAIFSHETPNFIEEFKEYTDKEQVGKDFGISSKTYQMASVVFAQNRGIQNVSGYGLYIVPLQSAVSAIPASFLTQALNISNFQAVPNGKIRVNIDGLHYDLTNLNFTKILTHQDILNVVLKALKQISGAYCYAKVIDESILFESLSLGASSTISLSNSPGGSGTDLSGANFFHVADGVEVDFSASSGETILEAIERIDSEISYIGFTYTLYLEKEKTLAIANSIQSSTKGKIFITSITAPSEFSYCKTNIIDAGLYKTQIATTGALENDILLRAGLLSAYFSKDIFANNGSYYSLHGKRLNNVPVYTISNIKNTALQNGIHYYGNYQDGFGNALQLSKISVLPEFASNAMAIQEKARIVAANQYKIQEAVSNDPVSVGTVIGAIESEVLLPAFRNRIIIEAPEDNQGTSFGNREDSKRLLAENGYYIFADIDGIADYNLPIYIALYNNKTILTITINNIFLN